MYDDGDWMRSVHRLGIVEENTILNLKWSASGVEFATSSERIEAVFKAEYDREDEAPYIGILVYGERNIFEKKIKIEFGTCRYNIYENPQKERVTVRLLKLTEEQYGKVGIVSLVADESLHLVNEGKRKILLIGDSITAAYGVDGVNGESVFSTRDEDIRKGYAYLSSETVEAEPIIVAHSGNGIISRWIPEEQEFPNTSDLLMEIFPYDAEIKPSLIVCNLGTNDVSYTRNEEEKEKRFVQQYMKFIKKLQKKFSGIPILLIYGIMEQSLNMRVKEVAEYCNVFYFELPLQLEADGLGTDAHPGGKTHRKLSNLLSEEIKRIMAW